MIWSFQIEVVSVYWNHTKPGGIILHPFVQAEAMSGCIHIQSPAWQYLGHYFQMNQAHWILSSLLQVKNVGHVCTCSIHNLFTGSLFPYLLWGRWGPDCGRCSWSQGCPLQLHSSRSISSRCDTAAQGPTGCSACSLFQHILGKEGHRGITQC